MKLKIMISMICWVGSSCWAQTNAPVIPENTVSLQGLTEDYAPVIAAIKVKGDAALESYTTAASVLAGNAFSRCYFDIFEGSGMEFTLNLKSSSQMLRIESGFSLIISQAMRGEPKAELEKTWMKLKVDMDYAVERYSSGGKLPSFWGRVIQSFLILFREGVEAMLVVAALVAYLRRSGYPDKVKIIWWGCIAALVASVGAAWLLTAVINASGANREAMEGITMLIAAAVLVYVSYWLTAKSSADKWNAFIKGKMDKAVSSGSMFTLGAVAFLAVFREGAETILFYQALMAGSAGYYHAVWTGMGLATIALAVVYVLIRFASIRMPLGLFFKSTAFLLFAMSFIFVGKGILEMQVSGMIPTNALNGWPMISWLGIFPTVQTMSGQALVLALIPFGGWVMKRKKDKLRGSAASAKA
ncbi:MAG: FTR1 family protein [Pontiella sp.]